MIGRIRESLKRHKDKYRLIASWMDIEPHGYVDGRL